MKVTRNFSLLAALLIAGAAFVSCDKDLDIKDSDSGKTYKYSVSVKASMGESSITKGILTPAVDGEGKNIIDFEWEENDKIYAYTVAGDLIGEELGYLVASNISGGSADFYGNLNFSTLPTAGEEIYLTNVPVDVLNEYESQNGTLSDIAKNFDISDANVSIESVNESSIKFSDATFESYQAILKLSLFERDAEGGSGAKINPTALTITYGGVDFTITGFNDDTYDENGNGIVYVPILGNNASFSIYAEKGDAKYQLVAPGDIEITNGKFYEITANMPRYYSLTEVDDEKFVGYVVTSEGNVLLNKDHSDAAGWTIGAVVAHVDSELKSAIAIHDMGTVSHGEAAEALAETCTAVTGVTWELLNYADFENMVGSNATTLSNYIEAAEGDKLLGNTYAMHDSKNKNFWYYVSIAANGTMSDGSDRNDHLVRPVFEF